jgi:hypothetical protein
MPPLEALVAGADIDLSWCLSWCCCSVLRGVAGLTDDGCWWASTETATFISAAARPAGVTLLVVSAVASAICDVLGLPLGFRVLSADAARIIARSCRDCLLAGMVPLTSPSGRASLRMA